MKSVKCTGNLSLHFTNIYEVKCVVIYFFSICISITNVFIWFNLKSRCLLSFYGFLGTSYILISYFLHVFISILATCMFPLPTFLVDDGDGSTTVSIYLMPLS